MVSSMNVHWVRRLGASLLRPALVLAVITGMSGAVGAEESVTAAQDATSAIRGTVSSADDGLALAGAVVTLVHVPSGSQKEATTGNDGGYAFTGLATGGPYTVTAMALGFVTKSEEQIFLTADRTRDVQFGLKLSE